MGQPADAAAESFEVFGTTAVIVVTEPRALAEARAIADRMLADVDLAASRFRLDSELVRLNAAAGQPVDISATFAQLLAAAIRAARLTGGDVDPTCARALTRLGYDRDFAQVRAAGDVPPRLTGAVGPVPGWRRWKGRRPLAAGGSGSPTITPPRPPRPARPWRSAPAGSPLLARQFEPGR